MDEVTSGVLEVMRERILSDARLYGDALEQSRDQPFLPGRTPIPASGKIIGKHEVANAVDAVLDGWLTEGRWVAAFERLMKNYIGVRCASMTNSGSSANLCAVSALKSPKIRAAGADERDGIITAAAGFPTTTNPIFQAGFTPVFVDIDLRTLVPSVDMIRGAITPETCAIVLAHTLGSPWPVEEFRHDEIGLWLIEDNCDALGSKIYYTNEEGDEVERRTGSIGHLSTQSFYPAHHITTGEGGMVLTASPKLQKIIESFRDWGRDCWCDPGEENTCGRRFDWRLGLLPDGYDHKYIYSHLGYNLKSTDPQAAIGVAQLKRFVRDDWVAARRANWRAMDKRISDIERASDFFYFHLERPNTEASWFGYPLTVREDAPFSREELVAYLAEYKIGTRPVFAGNYLWQPVMTSRLDLHYRQVGELPNTAKVAKGGFWMGVWPGVKREMMDYTAEVMEGFIKLQ